MKFCDIYNNLACKVGHDVCSFMLLTMDVNSNLLHSAWQHDDQPQGGVFIPPKGEDPTMYDMYKSPEEIVSAGVAPRQESAAPAYVVEPDDSEPGYILTPSGMLREFGLFSKVWWMCKVTHRIFFSPILLLTSFALAWVSQEIQVVCRISWIFAKFKIYHGFLNYVCSHSDFENLT